MEKIKNTVCEEKTGYHIVKDVEHQFGKLKNLDGFATNYADQIH